MSAENQLIADREFYQLVFELSEGYFFIDQILPFFTLREFENLYLTSKYISQLVMKQRHVHYLLVYNGVSSAYLEKNKHRWSSTNTQGYPSLLQFANGIRIQERVNLSTFMDYIIDYCKKENKLMNFYFDYYVYQNDFWNTFETPKLKALNQFGKLKADSSNAANFLKLFENKSVKKIEIRESYFFKNMILKSKPFMEKINFEELTFLFSGYSDGEIENVVKHLKNLDAPYKNKIKIRMEKPKISESFYPQLQEYINFFFFESVIMLPTDMNEYSENCNFELYTDGYNVTLPSLNNIEKLVLPKFSNPRPKALELKNVELALNPETVNTFYLLRSVKFLSNLSLVNCLVQLSNISRIEMKSLKTLFLSQSTFVKNGRECNLEFVESIDMPLLNSIRCDLKLQCIPHIHSDCLKELKLDGNQIENIELEKLTIHTSLTLLDLSNNNLNDLSNVQKIVGKYKTLKLEGNPFLKLSQIDNNRLVFLSNEFRNDTTRSKKLQARPYLSGSDHEIIKQLISTIKEIKDPIIPLTTQSAIDKEKLLQIISNPRKPKSFQSTNIIFWNQFYCNEQKVISMNGNTTSVEGVCSKFTQIAVHLNSTLQQQFDNTEWIFFGLSNHVQALDNEKVKNQLPTIVREWSFISLHFEYVKELRKQYPIH